ncbi:ATP-binding protein [bacterium]|nr:ATP-binding protein [candidate division CSSED10-310 bacterium]
MTGNILKEIILTVPMLPDMELAVSKTVDALSEFIRFKPDQVDEIKHAIIEAFVNASEHSRSTDQKIYLTFRVYRNKLSIQVTDKGIGFDPESVEEPRIEQKLFKNTRKRGWGLTLIKNFMDSVSIHSGPQGTTITMAKYAASNHQKEAVNE